MAMLPLISGSDVRVVPSFPPTDSPQGICFLSGGIVLGRLVLMRIVSVLVSLFPVGVHWVVAIP